MLKYTKITKSIQAALVALMLLATLATGSISSAQAQTGGPALFADAGSAGAQDAGPANPANPRSRIVTLQLGALYGKNGAALDAAALPVLSLNLFPDATFAGQVTQVQKSSGQTTWIGQLTDVPGGYFYMVAVDGAFIAHVASIKGIYEVSTAGNNLYRVIQIDQSKLVDDVPGKMEEPGPDVSGQDVSANADSGAIIDIMVVYTTAARVAEGSTAGMLARIALAVTESNQSYANAGITPRLRLVHAEEVAYTESGNIGTDVARLAGTTDGYMDVVHALRNIYGADMVSLVVNNGGGYCGMADAIMANAATAFQVTARLNCMTGYYSFGHEFGHLQGARHDPYVDNTQTPYPFGHGYVHTGTTSATRWRTVMAYNDRCSSLGYNCTRLQWWSNPTKLSPAPYVAAPMGVAGVSENYRVLNATAYTVANFRQTVISNNFSSVFTSNAAGWAPVNGVWGLVSSNYLFSAGDPSSSTPLASAFYGGIYGDQTYNVRMMRQGSLGYWANYIFIRGNPYSLDAAKEWKGAYGFAYRNSPATFGVVRFNADGSNVFLTNGWVSTTAVIPYGWNTLKIVSNGTLLRFYINGANVWNGVDASFRTGRVGVGMYRGTGITNDLLQVDYATNATTPTTVDVNPLVLSEQVIQAQAVNPSGAP